MIRLKYIIFDVGGVILFPKSSLLDNFLQISKQISLSQDKMIKIFKKYREKLSTGKIKMTDFLRLLLEKSNVDFTIKELENLFKKSFQIKEEEINEELLGYINHLHRKYVIATLSNCINVFSDNKKIKKYFDYIFNSYEIGFKKPDKRAFKYLLNKLKAKPKECLFIDDEKENVIMAESLGIKSIEYIDNKKLIASLKKVGIQL